MLDGLDDLLVGDKLETLTPQGIPAISGVLVGHVGRLQSISSKKIEQFQCLSAYRSCRPYGGLAAPSSARPPGAPEQRLNHLSVVNGQTVRRRLDRRGATTGAPAKAGWYFKEMAP